MIDEGGPAESIVSNPSDMLLISQLSFYLLLSFFLFHSISPSLLLLFLPHLSVSPLTPIIPIAYLSTLLSLFSLSLLSLLSLSQSLPPSVSLSISLSRLLWSGPGGTPLVGVTDDPGSRFIDMTERTISSARERPPPFSHSLLLLDARIRPN